MTDNYRTFLFSYPHEDSMWELEIKARDAEDAKARLAKLANAAFDGEQIAEVPASQSDLERVEVVVASPYGRPVVGDQTRH